MRRLWWRRIKRASKRLWAWFRGHPAAIGIALILALVPIVTYLVWSQQSDAERRDWNWGSYPEWVGGVGAAAAFLSAALVFNHDLKARRDEDRKSQARLVDAWVGNAAWSGEGTLIVEVCASNGSSQAVRGFHVVVIFADEFDMAPRKIPVIPPTERGNEPTFEFRFGLGQDAMKAFPADSLMAAVVLNIEFTDAAGNRWLRTADGELRWLYNLAEVVVY